MSDWPEEIPMCMHVYWGLVTIVGVDSMSLFIDGADRHLIEVHADQLYDVGHGCAPYANRAWLEHLKPLNRAAVEMLAACVSPMTAPPRRIVSAERM